MKTQDLKALLNSRIDAGNYPKLEATAELVQELTENVLNKIPSWNNTRVFVIGLGLDGQLQLIASPLNRMYGVVNATVGKQLADIEAGTLAAYITIYLLTKNIQTTYLFTGTPESSNVQLVLSVKLYKGPNYVG